MSGESGTAYNKTVAVHFSPGAASRAHSVEVSSAVGGETFRVTGVGAPVSV